MRSIRASIFVLLSLCLAACGGGANGRTSIAPAAAPTTQPKCYVLGYDVRKAPVKKLAPSICEIAPPSPDQPWPAPATAKPLYTASLVAHVHIDFQEVYSEGVTLTWHVTGDTSTFTNVQFATPTTGPPDYNDNTLSFDVPPDTQPKDYTLKVNVTSSDGNTGDTTTVTLRVQPPQTSVGNLNALGVYEVDSNDHLVVSDDSDAVTTTVDPTNYPDFPFTDAPAPSSAKRRTKQYTASGPFDPMNPPQSLAKHLDTILSMGAAGCSVVMVVGNGLNDRTQGVQAALGKFDFFLYCRRGFFDVNKATPQTLVVTRKGYSLNTQALVGQATDNLKIYTSDPDTYGSFDVFTSDTIYANPVSTRAERTVISYDFAYTQFGVPLAASVSRTYAFYVNSKGVFYPKVPVSEGRALRQVALLNGGYVPFPPKPFYRCRAGDPPPCLSDTERKKFASILVDAGVPAPPVVGYEAHHIKPFSWCGQNDPYNGIFMPVKYADPDELNAASHSAFTAWWLPANFSPDPVEIKCSDRPTVI